MRAHSAARALLSGRRLPLHWRRRGHVHADGDRWPVGFDAGNRTDYVEIMGSRTPTIHTTLCTMSNVGTPGIWRFQIRSGVVVCPDAGDACDTGMLGVCR